VSERERERENETRVGKNGERRVILTITIIALRQAKNTPFLPIIFLSHHRGK